MGCVPYLEELEDYDGEISDSKRREVENRVYKIASATTEMTMYQAASSAFTLVSLILTPHEENEVLVFVRDCPYGSHLYESNPQNRPDLVVFLTCRRAAEQVAAGKGTFGRADGDRKFCIPSPQQLVSAVFMDVTEARPTEKSYDEVEDDMASGTWHSTREKDLVLRCQDYLLWLSRHRPASYLQYGIVFSRSGFTFVSIGLHGRASWREVPWKSHNCVQKLCTCIKLVRDEALRPVHRASPKFRNLLKVDGVMAGVYSAVVGGKQFRLLPLFAGTGDGRKPFVALAVAETNQKDARVFKYSWHRKTRGRGECMIIENLGDVPGVVHLDRQLSVDFLESDEEGDYSHSLLVLKTIAYPLGACETVLEFAEAMYDLLEVLRFIVREKKILHRDVSWANVLIKPVDHDKGDTEETNFNVHTKAVTHAQEDKTDEGIPHTYRFISDIFNEDKQRVRVALTDFDHACDLNASDTDDLKDATGTPMFMATDVLNPRTSDEMSDFGPRAHLKERTIDEAFGVYNSKYADDSEKVAWDNFYRNEIYQLGWVLTVEAEDGEDNLVRSFRHGAVHDAESIFYISLLFFVRMWPLDDTVTAAERDSLEVSRGRLLETLLTKGLGSSVDLSFIIRALRKEGDANPKLKRFFSMLRTIADYLRVPWYNVASTRSGERYEFHLHDFMQRLLLKEIKRMREDGDHVKLAEDPLSVRTRVHLAPHQSSQVSVSPTKRQEEVEDLDDPPCVKRARLETEYVSHVAQAERVKEGDLSQEGCNGLTVRTDCRDAVSPNVGGMALFPEKFLEIYRWKRREKSWFSSDPLYR